MQLNDKPLDDMPVEAIQAELERLAALERQLRDRQKELLAGIAPTAKETSND